MSVNNMFNNTNYFESCCNLVHIFINAKIEYTTKISGNPLPDFQFSNRSIVQCLPGEILCLTLKNVWEVYLGYGVGHIFIIYLAVKSWNFPV